MQKELFVTSSPDKEIDNVSCARCLKCIPFLSCFLELSVGRVLIELFNDVCPKTCENFRSLCTGERGMGKMTGKPLHFKGVKFHRVIKGFMIQGGDFSQGTGQGGESIYGGTFDDESFEMKHDTPFLLSMANRGKNTNGSQFFITTKACPHLDGVHVVFGRVISGQNVVQSIEETEVDKKARPTQDIVIDDCGQLDIDSDSDEEEKRRMKKLKKKAKKKEKKLKKKLKKEKKKARKMAKKESKKTNDKEDEKMLLDNQEDEFVHCSIKPDEIPPIPENRFLDRAERLKEKKDAPSPESRTQVVTRDIYKSRHYETVDGRKVKGRGSLMFKRSRSPPHWRRENSRRNRQQSRDRRNDRDRNHSQPRRRRPSRSPTQRRSHSFSSEETKNGKAVRLEKHQTRRRSSSRSTSRRTRMSRSRSQSRDIRGKNQFDRSRLKTGARDHSRDPRSRDSSTNSRTIKINDPRQLHSRPSSDVELDAVNIRKISRDSKSSMSRNRSPELSREKKTTSSSKSRSREPSAPKIESRPTPVVVYSKVRRDKIRRSSSSSSSYSKSRSRSGSRSSSSSDEYHRRKRR
jgi:peptidyl-prolyl isomerase G (cyclophilin G)